MKNRNCLYMLTMALGLATVAYAEDWPRFRGPGGLGISDSSVPTTWSETENLAWKTPLPGPGSSSPIVSGDRVYVTCYSGYGVDPASPGNLEDLRRHLVCVDRQSGRIVWDAVTPAEMPEDEFRGYLTEHGYASSTPVTDGKLIFTFFGKTGVLAFDTDGNEIWKVNVGRESSNRRWGSGSSLVLVDDMVIVNASEESQSIRALDKTTGEEVWKAEARSLDLVYNTPTVIPTQNGDAQIVLSVPREIWALNARTGKLIWYAETPMEGNVCPTVLAADGVVYSYGGYQGVGSVAVRAGGTGDVSDSHIVWSSRTTSYVATPVLHAGHLFWIDDKGIAYCVNAETGDVVYQERTVTSNRGGGRRGGGKPVYASPVLVGDKIYVVSRRLGTFVLSAQPDYSVVATNTLESDDSDFNATPAVSDGQLFLRSNQSLYCVRRD
jgi:outer membrane protein assembly factor BamB